MSESSVTISVSVNGSRMSQTVPARLTLAELLRDRLGLTGTKVSCGMQVCGVCTVLVDGAPVSACASLAADANGLEVLTIEGVSEPGSLHPIQEAFIKEFALQCGFCTPGFVMMALALLAENSEPDRGDIVRYLDGNICRCTGYEPIIRAVQAAAAEVHP